MIVNRELSKLMENFYILTGIRIALFDENYDEIVSFPESGVHFCSLMRQNPEFNKRCLKCDIITFEKCKKTQSLTVYKCHAGLVEAAAPITDNGATIGYIMFGQISNNTDKDSFIKSLAHYCENFNTIESPQKYIKLIKYKSDRQITASSDILLACTSHILNKQMIKPSQKSLFNDIDCYISNHLTDDLKIESICRKFNISRTKLYEIMKQYINCGIAKYIKRKRILKAEELLLKTNQPISQITFETGFNDYNYFTHVFKKEQGVSPKQLRKQAEKNTH